MRCITDSSPYGSLSVDDPKIDTILMNSQSRNVAAYGYLGPRVPETSQVANVAYDLLNIALCARRKTDRVNRDTPSIH